MYFFLQVLITTSTLAWGVNFPAHLVIVKGTEYFDGKTQRYVDYPITDVLQMMGRAGRPQYDDRGVAVILVHDIKKHFYKKFLYEPFPVESKLVTVTTFMGMVPFRVVGAVENVIPDVLFIVSYRDVTLMFYL